MDFQDMLNECFEQKREFNPLYTLRAFARELGIPSSNLSNVLKKKQGLSRKNAEKIAKVLNFSSDDKTHFLNSVQIMCSKSPSERENLKSTQNKTYLNQGLFKLISSWYYYTILELFHFPDCDGTVEWFAKKLSLPKAQAHNLLRTLAELRVIRYVNGIAKSNDIELETIPDVPSLFVRKYFLQILKKAADSIWNQKVDTREFSSLTVAINKNDIEFVKKEIRKFKDKLDKKIVDRYKQRHPDDVYCLSIQFFSLLDKGENLKT